MNIFYLLLFLAVPVCSSPIPSHSEEAELKAEKSSDQNKAFAQAYLEKYYKPSDPGAASSSRGKRSLDSQTLAQMQSFFGLKVTGQLNSETLRVMKRPRCGLPDTLQFTDYGFNVKWLRGKLDKWQKTQLTYGIENYTSDMSQAEVNNSIARAFKVWADVTPLRFTRINSGVADIMISFTRRSHGDSKPFDGQGGTLAHASFPGRNTDVVVHFDDDERFIFLSSHAHRDGYPFDEQGGTLAHEYFPELNIGEDAHFNDDERFSFLSPNGVVLFLVAAHEFGHALGLHHSNVPGSLMFPTYRFQNPNTFVLPRDDINEIQALYGRPKLKDNHDILNLLQRLQQLQRYLDLLSQFN